VKDSGWLPSTVAETDFVCCNVFSPSSVASHAFSALNVYSKFRHHPHPLGYLCEKFHFFCGLHCWASPWRKIAYSLTQSPSLFDAPGTKAFVLQNMFVTRREGNDIISLCESFIAMLLSHLNTESSVKLIAGDHHQQLWSVRITLQPG